MMDPINTVIFNGTSLSDFGVYVSGNKTFSSAERDYEEIEIPGRSGNLFIDNKRFKNAAPSYDAWIAEDLEENLAKLRSFLGSSVGYQRLEDTYHKDEYYLAAFKGPLDVDTILLTAGLFTLKFNRKPQRFLKSGENPTEFTSGGSIFNPTDFESDPLIRVYGNGTIIINGYSIVIDSHIYPYVDIDCDVKDCFYYMSNCNNYIRLSTTFPKLSPGSNNIMLVDKSITKVEITPRWWKL